MKTQKTIFILNVILSLNATLNTSSATASASVIHPRNHATHAIPIRLARNLSTSKIHRRVAHADADHLIPVEEVESSIAPVEVIEAPDPTLLNHSDTSHINAPIHNGGGIHTSIHHNEHPRQHTHNHYDRFNIGLLGGLGVMTGNGGAHAPHGVAPVYRASVSYLFKNNFEIGAELGMTGNYPTFGIDLNYYLANHFFFGLENAMKLSNKAYFYTGPKVGFDYMVTPDVAIGPEVLYLIPLNGAVGIFEGLVSFKLYL